MHIPRIELLLKVYCYRYNILRSSLIRESFSSESKRSIEGADIPSVDHDRAITRDRIWGWDATSVRRILLCIEDRLEWILTRINRGSRGQ